MKKIVGLLGTLVVALGLTACGGSSSEIETYLSENESSLEAIFDTLGLGELTLTTTGDDQLVATFEATQETYEIMADLRQTLGYETTGDVFEKFIVEQHTGNMGALATAISNESELDEVSVRIVVMFDGEELVNLTFTNVTSDS